MTLIRTDPRRFQKKPAICTPSDFRYSGQTGAVIKPPSISGDRARLSFANFLNYHTGTGPHQLRTRRGSALGHASSLHRAASSLCCLGKLEWVRFNKCCSSSVMSVHPLEINSDIIHLPVGQSPHRETAMACWLGRHHWTEWQRDPLSDTCDISVDEYGRVGRATHMPFAKAYTRTCTKCGKLDFRKDTTLHPGYDIYPPGGPFGNG